MTFGDGVDNLRGGRGDHVTNLVGQAREAGAEGRGRELVEVDRNDAWEMLV